MNTTTQINVNTEQRLYVIPCNGGYSCLGFDVAEKRRLQYLAWLGLETTPGRTGTIEAYTAYCDALELVRERCQRTGERCPAELTRELIGLEGKRVELVYPDGSKTRFYVGKSTGFCPIHLEIKTRRSSGGSAVYFPAGTRVNVIR